MDDALQVFGQIVRRLEEARLGLCDLEQLELDLIEGVVVISVRRRSTASRLGFRKGDVITKLGNRQVRNLTDLVAKLRKRRRVWTMDVNRDGRVDTISYFNDQGDLAITLRSC